MQKLVLKSFLSPGDAVMMTAAVRDLHRAYPGRFLTDIRTSAGQLWENNPYVTPLDEREPDVRTIDMHYPLIQSCNTSPYHFIHGYVQFLEQELRLRIPVTEFKGDIHLADVEKQWMSQVEETGFKGRFWIMMAGGKYDFTAKWWNPDWHQIVVDHFAGRIQFVQCGERWHWHPPLENVIDLIGKTDVRQFIRLMHHADGVVCPVTFAMHLAAAVETKPGRPRNRACVVIAGGREPPHWEAYPFHQFISTNGALDCCDHGGCWKSRCQQAADACTSPKFSGVLAEGSVYLWTYYVIFQQIFVKDQFGNALPGFYAGAQVTEQDNVNINQTIHSFGYYLDPVGKTEPKPQPPRVVESGSTAATNWVDGTDPITPATPYDDIPDKVPVQVGGHSLSPSIANRHVIVTRQGDAKARVQIIWNQ